MFYYSQTWEYTGEYWMKDIMQVEQAVLASGGAPPPADAFTINGHPGPNYNCSANGKFDIHYSTFTSKLLTQRRRKYD